MKLSVPTKFISRNQPEAAVKEEGSLNMKHKEYSGIDASRAAASIHDSQEQLFRFRFQMGMGSSKGSTNIAR